VTSEEEMSLQNARCFCHNALHRTGQPLGYSEGLVQIQCS
jgi:hypothetical protein